MYLCSKIYIIIVTLLCAPSTLFTYFQHKSITFTENAMTPFFLKMYWNCSTCLAREWIEPVHLYNSPIKILSSPKLRCQMTRIVEIDITSQKIYTSFVVPSWFRFQSKSPLLHEHPQIPCRRMNFSKTYFFNLWDTTRKTCV